MGNEQGQVWKYEIPFGQAVGERVHLRAAASAVLNLEAAAGAADGSMDYSEVVWDPLPKRAAQAVEVRVKPIAFEGSIGVFRHPLIRWRKHFGHGTAYWQEPAPRNPGILAPGLEYTLPARGLMFRAMNRELRLLFRNGGDETHLGSLTNIQIQVTINPCGDADFGAQQYTQQRANFGNLVERNEFPISAREWCLRDEGGQPIAPGVPLALYSATAVSYYFTTCDLYADWQPIPAPALYWHVNAVAPLGAVAHYR